VVEIFYGVKLLKNIALILGGYIIGSIPFGYIAGKMRGIDIRKTGSGNIGSTNVSRVLGKKTGRIVQVMDIAKGAAPILIGHILKVDISIIVIAGLAAICGHNWTIFLGFKGGKGVNTSLGVALGLMPIPAIACFFIWTVVMLIWKYVSLASITASIAFPVIVISSGKYPLIINILSVVVAGFIVIRHRSNIKRLLAGTEPKIGKNKDIKSDHESTKARKTTI
jgi:acyl phosphate:glycerol-3-phosphate acyltransferase